MRILLMNPITMYTRWPKPTRPFVTHFLNIPGVTLPQLAACLPPKHQCEILDGVVERVSTGDFKRRIRDFDVIGISVYCSFSALNTELNLKFIKKAAPRAKVVLGGHHATVFHKEWIKKGADFVVRGEGEVTFPALIEAIENDKGFAGIKGITYSSGGEIAVNPDRDFLDNLDETPVPRWDLVDFGKYGFFYRRKGFTGSIETSRGCVHRCSFCLSTLMWKHTQRYKSKERVMRELKMLKGLGVTKMLIVDDNLGEDYSRDAEIFRRMKEDGLDMTWAALFRVDNVLARPELVDLASAAGCRLAMIGLESLNFEELVRNYKKGYPSGINPDSYEEAYRLFRKNGIFVLGCFVGGFLELDVEKAVRAINAIREHGRNLSDVSITIPIRPFPGTDFYRQAEEKGILSKNTFYYEGNIPNIKGLGKVFKLIKRNYFGFFLHPRQMLKVFSRSKTTSDWFKSFYCCFFADQFRYFNLTALRCLLRGLLSRKLSEEQRQNELTRFYTDDKFIDKLVSR